MKCLAVRSVLAVSTVTSTVLSEVTLISLTIGVFAASNLALFLATTSRSVLA